MKAKYISMFAIAALALTACNDDEEEDPTVPESSYTIPTTYSFTDIAGNNTVSFQGQTDRLNQLGIMTTYMKTAHTPGVTVSPVNLKNMYANEGGNGGGNFDFSSTKDLKSKTASTFSNADDVKMVFEEMMENLAMTSQTTTDGNFEATLGTAGSIQSDQSGPYLVDANGHEYVQFIEKGLMGAVFYNQITGVYLSDDKIGNQMDNSTPVDPENGKYYTEMEHHWDEAFGYFSSSTTFPDNDDKRFWSKYSNTVDPILGTNEKIMDAFLTGRAAIANADMTTKEEMRDIIIAELEKVTAGTAIHYFNSTIAAINENNTAGQVHVLSEAYVFLDNMRFNPNATISTLEINALLDQLGIDFYNISVPELAAVRDQLGEKMGFTAAEISAL